MKRTLLTAVCQKLLTRWMIAVAFLLVIPFQGKAQVSSTYTFSEGTTTYTNLQSDIKNILISGAWNDLVVPTPIGFTFQFNSVTYADVNVSANGFITFGTTPPLAATTTPISVATAYAGAVSGWGSNLLVNLATADATYPAFQANAISKQLIGTAPNRILKIEYRDANIVAAGSVINFQIWLYETTNVIEVHYKEVASMPTIRTGQVGLRGTANTDYNNRLMAAAWPASGAVTSNGTANNSTCRITTTGIPATANRMFRWTPSSCSSPTGLLIPTITDNGATLQFTPATPTPSNGYDYEIVNASATVVASGTAAMTGGVFAFSGLLSDATYTIRIRSNCGASFSPWVTSPSFTTFCSATNVPYYEGFDSVASGNIPSCTSRINVNADPRQWEVTATPDPESGLVDEHLIYRQSGSLDANDWFFTRGINFTAGKQYILTYYYGGSSVPTSIINRMEVRFGTYPSVASMTLPLDNHPTIKGSPSYNTVVFTAPTTGVYYLGFKAYSILAQGKLFLDDIFVNEFSDCGTPSALAASSITNNTAIVSWTPASPNPISGHSYYITTNNPVVTAGNFVVGQTYTIASVGTTNFTLIGASSNTVGTQFVATAPFVFASTIVAGQTYTIRSLGGTITDYTTVGAPSNNIGVTFTATGTPSGTGTVFPALAGTGTGTATLVLNNNIPPTGSVSPGIPFVNLTGLANNTTYYIWVRGNCGPGFFGGWSPYFSFTTDNAPAYCVPSATSSASYFSNFKTTGAITNIDNNSAFASPSGYADYTNLIVTQSPGQTINFNTTIVGPTVGVAIWVDWNSNGTFEAGERMYNTGTYVSTASGAFTIPGGTANGNYRMRIVMDYWRTSPDPCSINLLFGTQRGEAEDYTIKVLPPPPPLTLSIASSSQCSNTNSPLVTLTAGGPPTFNSYTWSPSTGVSGSAAAGWTFNANSTTVYTLTAAETVSPFRVNTVVFTYNATPAPTPVVVSPDPVTVCQTGPAQMLTSTGGIVNGSVVLSENFESGASTWTRINNSIAGNVAASAWTIRPDGFNRPPVFNSNDNSSFVFCDSDAQGADTTTDVIIESPIFSLANYSSANLSFWHHLRGWTPQTALAQISSDGGATWTTLLTYGTANVGTPTAFANATSSLVAYLGQTNLKIRFRFTASYGWFWAIDNVAISGTRDPQIQWNLTSSPVANGANVPGLFTNALATTPYVAGNFASTVYALPSVSTNYTAQTSTTGCSVSDTVQVNVTPLLGGTVSGSETSCDSSFANLTLSGHVGTIVRWEYADDAAFTINVNSIANTTSTLTPAELGPVFYGVRYFRAVLGSGSCPNAYSAVASKTVPFSVWDGVSWSPSAPTVSRVAVFRGGFTSASSLSACKVFVENAAAVSFTSGTLTVQSTVHIVSGSLNFESDASLLQPNNVNNAVGLFNGGNIGNITTKRNTTPVYRFDYTYWSAPVYPQTIGGFTPLSMLAYVYNSALATPAWQHTPFNVPMVPGKGYIARAPSNFASAPPAPPSIFTANFTGVPNNGLIRFDVVGGANQLNLIGNPYPSAIDIERFLIDTNNDPLLDGTVYLWTHNTPINTSLQYSGTDYALYNFTGPLGTGSGTAATNPGLNISVPTKHIASGQSFFIKGLATGTALFNNSMRVAGNNSNFFRSSSTNENSLLELEKNRYWVDFSNTQGAFKQLLVGYIETATNGRDRLFDGELSDAGNVINIYTKIDNTKYSIQGRSLPFDVTEQLVLGFKSTAATSYTVRMSKVDGLFTQQPVYLEDTYLNVIHNLAVSDYTFATEAGTFEDRFILRYTDATLSNGDYVFSENALVVYKSEQNLVVNSGKAIMAKVEIHDIRGRLLADQKAINATETRFTTLPQTNQILLVTVTDITGTKVTKKVHF